MYRKVEMQRDVSDIKRLWHYNNQTGSLKELTISKDHDDVTVVVTVLILQ